jgi:hypothetical protein
MAQDLHDAQYLWLHNIPHGPNDSPPPLKEKISTTLHNIAILVPHDELVMKSYMHIRLAIVAKHYHNLNSNTEKQDYWLLTSNVGIKNTNRTKLQHRTKKNGYFPTFWALPVCRTL